jgi:DNA polymerase-3 subunit gamma/tau
MKALYRRYRPKTLAEVIGQEQITSVLEKSLKNHKISHAYLFIGPRGTGKTSVARILAHEINGFKYELEDDYLDIIEIDAASNTGVDNIRDLRERAIIAPTKGKFKVYIIDEVHMLSKSAFNALLKTLEEPPEHVVFIMATTDAHKVPITITSRSQVYTFKLANPSTMFDHLKDICKKEKIKITDDAIKIVVKRGGGSFRDSLSLLDQVSTISDGEIDGEMLTKALGLPQEAIIESLINAYVSGDLATIRNHLTELTESGIKAEITANELVDAIIANPEPQLLPLLDKLIEVNRSSNPTARLLLALCQSQNSIVMPRQIAQAPIIQKAAAPVKPQPTPKTADSKTSQPAPLPEPEPAPQPIAIANDTGATEIWQKIIAHVAEKHPLLAPDIVTAKYTFENKILKIYTGNYVRAKNIEKRRNAIAEILPGDITIEITKEKLATDPEVANIAAIMGGGEEVEINE